MRIIDESESKGIWMLQAGISPENAASLALVKACGFREVGRRERIGQMDGVWRDVILVERRSKVVGIEKSWRIEMKEKLDSILIRKLNSFSDLFLSEKDGVLDKKTIELVATAVSICVDCSPCTDFHISEAINNGATSEQINKVFKIVMAVSAGKRKVFSRGLESEF